MTGMMDFYHKIMDELNEPAEANDNPPDFEKSIESVECPFCHKDEYLICKRYNIHHIITLIISCPLCERSWASKQNELTGEIKIIGEIDNPFLGPDDLE